MGPVDIVFEAIDNSMLSIESRLDDPKFAHDKDALKTAHLAIWTLRQELFTIIKREHI
jgi:hypothetical protein